MVAEALAFALTLALASTLALSFALTLDVFVTLTPVPDVQLYAFLPPDVVHPFVHVFQTFVVAPDVYEFDDMDTAPHVDVHTAPYVDVEAAPYVDVEAEADLQTIYNPLHNQDHVDVEADVERLQVQ